MATFPFSLPCTANKFVLKTTQEILPHASSLPSLHVCLVSFSKFHEHDTHARLVADMLAIRQTILMCRDGMKVASILVASSCDTHDIIITC